MPLLSRIAAMHRALWQIDRGYRWWWYIWPVSIALLICGWIYVERPVVTTTSSSASWGKPAPAASNADLLANPPAGQRGDAARCYHDVDFKPSQDACSRLLEAARERLAR
jgi:hypothetical protein